MRGAPGLVERGLDESYGGGGSPGPVRDGATRCLGGRGLVALWTLLVVVGCSDPPGSRTPVDPGPDAGSDARDADGDARPDRDIPGSEDVAADGAGVDTGDLDTPEAGDAQDLADGADTSDTSDADAPDGSDDIPDAASDVSDATADVGDTTDVAGAEGVRDVFVAWLDEVRVQDQGQPVTGALAQRLPVDALRRAVTVVAGNDAAGRPITWRVPRSLSGTGTLHRYRRYDLFTGTYDICSPSSPTSSRCDGFHDLIYGRVLGRPDFYEIPLEGRAIDLTYAKLVRDMAWNVCDQMIQADLLRANPGGNSLSIGRAVAPAPDEATLRVILGLLALKFHGLDLNPDSPEIDGLLQLFRAGMAAVEHPELDPLPAEAEGYRAVCVALFEDPAFHLW